MGKLWIWLSFIVIIVVACGSGSGGENHSGGSMPVKRAPQLIGYSLVNAWHLIDPDDFAEELAAGGLTATEIEWTPFIGSPAVCGTSTNATYPEQAKKFVDAMRKKDITVYINIVNANGCATTQLPDAWFQGQLDVIKGFGIDGIILGGVSEPWAVSGSLGDKMLRWERLAENQWTGFFALPANDGNGVAYWQGFSYDYLDSHPCNGQSLNVLFTKGKHVIPNTDCGPLLNPGPIGAAEWTRAALDSGSNLLVYDFRGTQVDSATIAAMGAEIQK